jgi:hypothetical protein
MIGHKETYYRAANWGLDVWAGTIISCTILLLVAAIVVWLPLQGAQGDWRSKVMILPYTIVVIELSYLAWMASGTIKGYAVSSTGIELYTFRGRVPLISSSLKNVAIDPVALNNALRVWGTGGMFRLSGIFKTKTYGLAEVFVSNAKKSVILQSAQGNFIVSPDSPEEFKSSVKLLYHVN